MVSGWRYRLGAAGGTVIGAILAVTIMNQSMVLALWQIVPVVGSLQANTATGNELIFEIAATAVVFLIVMAPLYRPRPRRILDTVLEAQKRVLIGVLVLATVGYFDYTYRLPRLTLIGVGVVLLLVLPIWYVEIRKEPNGRTERAVIIGDDHRQITRIMTEANIPFLGYLSPGNGIQFTSEGSESRAAFADGGSVPSDLKRLGGLSSFEDVLVEYDIPTAVFAFHEPDRAEFFGTLHACWEHGVDPKVHESYSDFLLTEGRSGPLVDVAIEPWDLQDYALKRLFDVVFAATGLVVLLPTVILISAAIKLDSPGPVLFSQPRTTRFGRTFTFYKFRSMVPDAEERTGVVVSREDAGERDPRVTRVGRFLRQTHLDEIPQLWSILIGDMSVVGPRPAQTEIEDEFEEETSEWVKRWFVKPGLTGLAQIEGATGLEPTRKLHYDLLYIQQQSLTFDVKIVIRQLWSDAIDVYRFLRRRDDSN